MAMPAVAVPAVAVARHAPVGVAVSGGWQRGRRHVSLRGQLVQQLLAEHGVADAHLATRDGAHAHKAAREGRDAGVGRVAVRKCSLQRCKEQQLRTGLTTHASRPGFARLGPAKRVSTAAAERMQEPHGGAAATHWIGGPGAPQRMRAPSRGCVAFVCHRMQGRPGLGGSCVFVWACVGAYLQQRLHLLHLRREQRAGHARALSKHLHDAPPRHEHGQCGLHRVGGLRTRRVVGQQRGMQGGHNQTGLHRQVCRGGACAQESSCRAARDTDY
jgi:hypothetical protein